MLSEYLFRNRIGYSLLFTTLFSLFSMIWNGNSLSQSIVSIKNLSLGVSSSLSDFSNWTGGLWTSLEDYQKIVEERNALLKELNENDVLYSKYLRLKDQNKRLREDMDFKPQTDYKTVKAKVLSVRLSTIYKIIIIDKGSKHNLKPYMPVITKVLFKGIDPKTGKKRAYRIQALVGKIISVDEDTAVIQPLANSDFKCGVRIPGSRLWATLDGNSDRILKPRLQYISSFVAIDKNKLNRPLVTSGKGGLFPPGIPVGRIIGIDLDAPSNMHISGSGYKSAYVEPFARLESLESVVVILKRPDAWASHWPNGKAITANVPELSEKQVKPSQTSDELPGTSKFASFVPELLAKKIKKKLAIQAKKKKSKSKKKYYKKKKKKKSVNLGDEDEFGDVYLEPEPVFDTNDKANKKIKAKKNKTDEVKNETGKTKQGSSKKKKEKKNTPIKKAPASNNPEGSL